MQSFARSHLGRSLSIVIIVSMLSAGCTPGFLDPVPGLPEYQTYGLVPVPGGTYSTVGANLMIERVDLSVDTILGEQVFGAVYNSANGVWHWSHKVSYSGSTFVDPTGATYNVTGIANGSAIPGSHWVKLSSTQIKSKGGYAYTFDAQGRIDHVNWASDSYPRIIYLWSANLLQLRRCNAPSIPIASCPGIYSISLGPNGPTQVVDEQSALAGNTRLSSYTYDSFGRLATAKTAFELDQGLPGTLYEYETLGTLIAAQTSSEGVRIEYDWDPGRLLSSVKQIGEGDPTHEFTHEIYQGAYVVTHVNPVEGTTKYFLDGQRRLLFQQFVNTNESRMFTWPGGALRPSQINDIDGTVTRYPQWVNDDPARIIEPSGNEILITYQSSAVNLSNPRRRPVSGVTDSIGAILSFTFDPQGRPDVFTTGEGDQSDIDYQGLTPTSETTPWGATALLTNFGIHGHWVDAEVTEWPNAPVRRKFDVVGNLTVPAAGLQQGGVLERAYNEDRWLSSVSVAPSDDSGGVGPAGTVSIERRSDGQIKAYRRPSGGDHEFEYDSLGRQHLARERVNGVWQTTETSYNSLGLVTAIEKPNGMREEFDYDVYARLIARRAFKDGVPQGEVTYTWSQGRITQSHDSVRDQDTIIGYDAAGRVSSLTYSEVGESLVYEYDLRSRNTGRKYTIPGSPAVVLELKFDWDLANRQTMISRVNGTPGGELLVEKIYEDDRLATINYGNGLVRETQYDATTLAPSGFEMRNDALQVVETTSFSDEVKTGPTRIEVVNETTSPLAHTKEEYWLNRPGNLALAEGKIGARVFRWRGWEGGVLEDERFFAWDELSNPASDLGGDTFTYNAERNRLLSVTGPTPHTYTYDESGLPETRDGLTLSWNGSGQLERVGPVMTPLVSITWDMGSRPVSITVAGVTRNFPLFGGLVEYDSGSGELGWVHLAEVSVPFLGSARVYRHIDFLGNTSLVSDATGAIVAHKRYHPFGVETEYLAVGYTERHPTGFVGGLELAGTGLVWLGARILDSDVGRFLSPDPVLQELQQYTYASGNPIWFWDPDGRHEMSKAEANVVFAIGLVTVAAGLVAIAVAFSVTAPAFVTAGAILGGVAGVLGGGYMMYQAGQHLFGGMEGGGGGGRGSTGSGRNGPNKKKGELELAPDWSQGAIGGLHFFEFYGGGAGGGGCAIGPRALPPTDARWQWMLVLLLATILLLAGRRLRGGIGA